MTTIPSKADLTALAAALRDRMPDLARGLDEAIAVLYPPLPPEILPCPFCGGRAVTLDWTGNNGGTEPCHHVRCVDPYCRGYPSYAYQSQAMALVAWNRRAPCQECADLERSVYYWKTRDDAAEARCREAAATLKEWWGETRDQAELELLAKLEG